MMTYIFIGAYFVFLYSKLPSLSVIFLLIIPFLQFYSLKITIQRFYDLNLSGWYILLKLIPIFSIGVTFYLYFKKGNCEINEYDKAIDYRKLFKDRHCMNIYNNILIVDEEEYRYERYLDKYMIKIFKYGEGNFFTEYLQKNYQINEDKFYKTVEITNDELENTITKFDLLVIDESSRINIKGFKIFMRTENFKYTIILDKKSNEVSKELFDIFDFPGAFFEDEKYIYYNKIYKNDLLEWVKNVA